ncbi:MAG: hypothetical protein ACTSVY_01790 [Candidatus Helarchaeota archaeon]
MSIKNLVLKNMMKETALFGFVLGIFSLFLPWYEKNEHGFFTIIYVWDTQEGYAWNNWSFYFMLIFLMIIAGSCYSMLMKNPENASNLKYLEINAIINLAVPIIQASFLIVFPLVCLIPQGHVFPFVYYSSEYFSTISMGYFLMCISFVLVFPYIFQYYKIITSFEIFPQYNSHNNHFFIKFLDYDEKHVQDEHYFEEKEKREDEQDLITEHDIDLDILIEIEKEKLKKLNP